VARFWDANHVVVEWKKEERPTDGSCPGGPGGPGIADP
jgi:hypothetical protein